MRLSTTSFLTAVLLPTLLCASIISAIAIEPRAPPVTQHHPHPEKLECKPWKPKGVYGSVGTWRGEILFYSDRTYGKDDDGQYDDNGKSSDAAPRVANVSMSGNATEVSGGPENGETSSDVDDSDVADDSENMDKDEESKEPGKSKDTGGDRKPQHDGHSDEYDDDEYDEDYDEHDEGKHDDGKRYLPGKAHNKAEPWRLAKNKYMHYPFAFSNCTYKPLNLGPEVTQSCSRGGCYRTYTTYSQIKSYDECLTSSTYEPRKEKATFNWERCEYKDQRKARKQLFRLSQTVQYTHNFGKVVRYGDVDLQNIQTSYTQGPYVAWYIKPSDRKHLIRTTPYPYTQRGIYARVLEQ